MTLWRDQGALRLQDVPAIDVLRRIVLGTYVMLDNNPTPRSDAYREWDGISADLRDYDYFRVGNVKSPDIAGQITDCVRAALKSQRWTYEPAVSYFRRIDKNVRANVEWHVDAEATIPKELRDQDWVTLWIPLDDVGVVRPSLEIILGSDRFMRPAYDPDMVHRSATWVQNSITEWCTPCIPIMRIGEAFLFNQYTLHRNQIMPDNCLPRHSCEMRFAAARDA